MLCGADIAGTLRSKPDWRRIDHPISVTAEASREPKMKRLPPLKPLVIAGLVQTASVVGLTLLTATSAQARLAVVPEPSVLSLAGIAAVAGIVVYRLKKRK
jgi:hypothetical protein